MSLTIISFFRMIAFLKFAQRFIVHKYFRLNLSDAIGRQPVRANDDTSA
ncbi:protein of unassigned function [Methylobacterium oryzae CBMB20]|uniref:Protein of unassigned function n=1 Tax=Methylobacterium oryzae CBMB20 TaxID=693986 RepID=A0A089NVN0_9HYPH|nr:protein of unassigned function [Methylobacterium oryzae CBMB20]